MSVSAVAGAVPACAPGGINTPLQLRHDHDEDGKNVTRRLVTQVGSLVGRRMVDRIGTKLRVE